MKDRSSEDFSDILTGLIFNTDDIVAVSSKTGVYYNPKAKVGFQYAAAFATVDDKGGTWIETFGIEKGDTGFTIRGRYGSKYMGKGTFSDDVTLQASEMIDRQIHSL